MEELKSGWQVKGTYNEACAAEGHHPYYFGRDVEGGCMDEIRVRPTQLTKTIGSAQNCF